MDGVGEQVEAFLKHPDYQEEFWKMAKAVGYDGDDEDKMRVALFMEKNGQIGFVIGELNDMFVEFQVLENLKAQPIFFDILQRHPEAKDELLEVGLKLLKTQELDTEKFNQLMEKYND